jgi:membrane associated rhomboid family serine protease
MIPLRDVIPSRTTPIVTLVLIGVNAVVFLYEQSLAPGDLAELVGRLGILPADFHWSAVLPSMFLHGGWVHLLGNMLYLWIFGDNVEDRLGHGRFALFYLLCGAAAALAQAATTVLAHVPMIGASGAIAGVIGAYFVLFPRSRVLMLIPLPFYVEVVEVPAVFFLGFWLFLQLVSGFGSLAVRTQDIGGVAFWAHVAGFAAGAAGVWLFRRPERQRVEWWS